MAERPESIQSVEHRPDGSWTVSWRPPPLYGTEFPVCYVVVSAEGVLLQRWQDAPHDRRETTFQYSTDSPRGFPLASRYGPSGAELALVRVEFFPEGNLAPFSQGSVAEHCYENSAVVQLKQQALAAGFPPEGDRSGPGGHPTPVPFAGRQLRGLRWPLVVAGAILVLLAAIEVYRRRSA